MSWLKDMKESLLHLAFPHVCAGCGNDILDRESMLCLDCLSALPQTGFHRYNNNPVEKVFWGRLPLLQATAHFYFTKASLMQRLMHSFKYRGNQELGIYLGRLIGADLVQSGRFSGVEALIPLPLFAKKQKQRGFNQADVLCKGIAGVIQLPVLENVITRPAFTETQTKKNRVERWQNMEGKFELARAEAIANKHILLVDDVVTTGATLEACGHELLKAENVQLSIATLCYSLT
jgi:ComF family protein